MRFSENGSSFMPSSLTKEGDAMSIMEILTLLLVIFAALSYIDDHKKK